jgi:hypothetical protein
MTLRARERAGVPENGSASSQITDRKLNTQLFGDSRIRSISTVEVLGFDDILLVCHPIQDSRQYVILFLFETLELS